MNENLLQKLSQILNVDKIMSPEDVLAIKEAIIGILANNKKEVEGLTQETKVTVEAVLSKILDEHDTYLKNTEKMAQEVKSSTTEAVKQAREEMETVKRLCKEVMDSRPKDGEDADEEKIVADVLAQIKLPEYKEVILDDGGQIVDKINALPVNEENQIDASHIKNLPKVKSVGGGITQARVLQLIQENGGSGSPGGSTTQLQYNNAGSFGGISGATTDGTAVTYSAGNLIAADVTASGSGGFLIQANNGTDVALFGAGGGAGATFYGGVNLNTMTQGSVLFAGASGAITQDNSNFFWDDTNNRLGVGTISPAAAIHANVTAINQNGIRASYTAIVGDSGFPLSVVNDSGLVTFSIGKNKTATEGNVILSSPSGQGDGVGINFNTNVGAGTKTGNFQMDGDGNMVFRSNNANMFFDSAASTYFRNSSFVNQMMLDGTNANIGRNSAFGASTLRVYDGTATTGATTLLVQGGASAADATTNNLFRVNQGGGTTGVFVVSGAGKVGVGMTAPTALLHLAAGTASASTAPLKFTAGTVNTTPEAGTMEFTNSETGLTFTAVSTRRAVVLDTATQTLSGKTLTTPVINGATLNGDLQTDGLPDTDDTWNGKSTNSFNAAGTIAQFDCVYMTSSSTWALTDADAIGTAGSVLVMMAGAAGTVSNPLRVIEPGSWVRNDAWNWTVGGVLYLDTATPGGMTQTVPSGTDDVVKIIGHAVSADVIYFNPSVNWIIHT